MMRKQQPGPKKEGGRYVEEDEEEVEAVGEVEDYVGHGEGSLSRDGGRQRRRRDGGNSSNNNTPPLLLLEPPLTAVLMWASEAEKLGPSVRLLMEAVQSRKKIPTSLPLPDYSRVTTPTRASGGGHRIGGGSSRSNSSSRHSTPDRAAASAAAAAASASVMATAGAGAAAVAATAALEEEERQLGMFLECLDVSLRHTKVKEKEDREAVRGGREGAVDIFIFFSNPSHNYFFLWCQ
jgi:hypothetical protein